MWFRHYRVGESKLFRIGGIYRYDPALDHVYLVGIQLIVRPHVWLFAWA